MAAEASDVCFDLAVACCRFAAGAGRDDEVGAAARAIADWPRALRLIRHHRIDGLAYAALTAARVSLPADVAATLRRRAEDIARDNLSAVVESTQLQRRLDAAGIRALHLKGMALAQLAYGTVALKFSQDIDLLVSPQDAAAAIHTLESDGYRLVRPAPPLDARQLRFVLRYGREVALRHRVRGRQVEVRWQAVRSPSLLRGVDAHSVSQDVGVSDNAQLRTLNDDDLFAYLCVHGAGHGWSRLQWLADLNAWLATKDDATLRAGYRHAEAVGAGTCAAMALLLCRRLFDAAMPADIAQAAERNGAARWAAALSLRGMSGNDAGDGARRFRSTRIVMMQLLLGTNLRHYVSFVRELAFGLDDMLAVPLPMPLHPIYPLARLPLWLWRKLALGPKRKARKEAGSA